MVARLPAYPPTRGARRPRRAIRLPGCPRGRAAFLEVASLDFYRKRPRRLRLGRGTAFFPKESGGKERAGGLPPAPPKSGGPWRRWAVQTGQRPSTHCRPFRRHKFQIIRFAASGKAHSFHCALTPVAALRFPGQTGPPIAPLLFPGSLYPPLAALRRETLPTEPAAQPLAALPPYGCGVPLAGTSLGFGGGPIYGDHRSPLRTRQLARAPGSSRATGR